jgi:hypothetical protein
MHWTLHWTIKIYFVATIISLLTFYFAWMYCDSWVLVYGYSKKFNLRNFWYQRALYYNKNLVIMCMIVNLSSGVIMCLTIYLMTRLLNELNESS